MDTTIETVAPFVWDKDYNNTEQLRPYLADFMALKDSGLFYNADFKGKIPGLTNSTNEDTAIYLLQRLADLESLRSRTQEFIDAGGYRLTERLPNPTERGTLVLTAFYVGGTGWQEVSSAIVTVAENGDVRFKLPRQKNWRTHRRMTTSYLFMPDAPR